MKLELDTATYDEESGISLVTIRTDLGYFDGMAFLNPEDKEIASRYAGCDYAEMRATIKYMKERIKILTYERKGVQDTLSLLENIKEYNPHSIEARKIRRRIYELTKEIEEWKENVVSLNQKLQTDMENRSKIINKIKR